MIAKSMPTAPRARAAAGATAAVMTDCIGATDTVSSRLVAGCSRAMRLRERRHLPRAAPIETPGFRRPTQR